MKLYFYKQLFYGGRLTDFSHLPKDAQARITENNRHLESCLRGMKCLMHPEFISHVLPEVRKRKVSFSVFTCCPPHAFDVQKTFEFACIRGECLTEIRPRVEADTKPVAPYRYRYSLFYGLRSLCKDILLLGFRSKTNRQLSTESH